jgi:hypothetical protein
MSSESTSYETELGALAERLAALDAARDAHRAMKAKHVELLARLAQHFPGRDQWKRRATTIVDDNDGNGSYPPDEQWTDHSGPILFKIEGADYSTEATAGGFYHDCRAGTGSSGLYVSRDGTLYGANFTGTCRFGQFPAHPGICDRDIAVEWDVLPMEDISNDDYDAAIAALRKLIA